MKTDEMIDRLEKHPYSLVEYRPDLGCTIGQAIARRLRSYRKFLRWAFPIIFNDPKRRATNRSDQG